VPSIITDARQRIFPLLAYDDTPAATDFLGAAFGFVERSRMNGPAGTTAHAEVALAGNVVMLATTWKAGGMASPRNLPAIPTQLFCEVDDVDAHLDRAKSAGAVMDEPETQPYGFRVYRVLDPEGHRWLFASPCGERQ
jgi:PhnB protein